MYVSSLKFWYLNTIDALSWDRFSPILSIHYLPVVIHVGKGLMIPSNSLGIFIGVILVQIMFRQP